MRNISEIIVIKNGIIITMDTELNWIEDGAVVVKDSQIIDINKTHKIDKKYKGDIVIDAKNKVVMPGLINTHMHSGLLRGTGDDLPLYEWLSKYVHPAHKVLKPDEAYAASLLSYSEAVKCGTTCLLDMYRFMDRSAEAAGKLGIRAVLAPYVSDQLNYLESFEDNKRLIREKHRSHKDRIHVWCGLHSFRDCSPELLIEAREYANKYNVGLHTHSNESIDDVELAKKMYGKRPLEHLFDYGIVGPNVVLAHCVWLSNTEIEMIKKTNTRVAHCPIANMKLADGVAAIPKLLENRIKVGLGSDGTVESNSFDLFQVMKFATLLSRVHGLRTDAMSAEVALEMATLNGAKVLGLNNNIGSIEVGKKADIIIVNLRSLHLTPILYGGYFNVISHLAYAAKGSDVDTVIVDGKVVMENRIIKTVDETKVIEKAQEASTTLLRRMSEL